MSARIDLPSGLVTFLFTDIEGSTRLAHVLGDDYRSVLHEHRAIVRCALFQAEGIELFTEGDSLFVAFPDAASAILACAQAQRDLREYDWADATLRPRVRMGLHSGNAVPQAGEYTSREVHRAARVASAAHGDQILCSEATARLASASGQLPDGVGMHDLGLHVLRGFDGRERLFQLVAPGLEQTFPRPRTAHLPPHNLPADSNRFIGRVTERVDLRRLLTATRYLTIVGPGGSGKTRLAVEVSRTVVDHFRDGVWFVDLVENRGVDEAVALALGIGAEPGRPLVRTIADHVADRCLLLVLDTCDVDLGAARGLIEEVLAVGPQVTVIATSREPMDGRGETVWRVPSLRQAPPSTGGLSDAVALLADRAAAARGGRNPTPAEIVDFERVARAVDGLPLALELAAARLRVLSSAQLAARIDQSVATLDVGAGPAELRTISDRHQSMLATIDWSYQRLRVSEARLLREMSVFGGAVDLSAIEGIHGADPLGTLASLVDKSLVQADIGREGATYRLLSCIRQFSADQLAKEGEERSARDRHIEWCLTAVRRPDGQSGISSLYPLDSLASELRGALRWAVTSGRVRRGLALVSALRSWWCERGLSREGRMWLFRFYDRVGVVGEAVPDDELATAYYVHARLAGADSEHAEELNFARKAEDLARRGRAPSLVTRSIARQGAALMGLGRHQDAEWTCRAAMACAERSQTPSDALVAVYVLAEVLWRRGEWDDAADLLAMARSLETATPHARGRRTVDFLLGLVALSRSDLVAAHEYLTAALRSRMAYGFHARACETLSAMAVRCALGGEPEMSARLFGAAQAARARLGCAPGAYGFFWAEYHGAVRSALGDAAFDAAYAEGGVLSLENAVELALTVEHPDLVAGSSRF